MGHNFGSNSMNSPVHSLFRVPQSNYVAYLTILIYTDPKDNPHIFEAIFSVLFIVCCVVEAVI